MVVGHLYRHGRSHRTRLPRYSTRAFWAALSILSCLALCSYLTTPFTTSPRLFTRDGHSESDKCRFVNKAHDKCAFIREHCLDDEPAFAAYLDLYYCYLADAKPLAFILLLVWISTLFNTIGIAASDFFCVNLSTVATALGMSESMAGVTLLAFGNGSPDVFSTFAAMSTDSSSLAIGELIGAASFITAVVAGSMALVRPFRVAKKSFVRDLAFFIVAAAFSMGFLIDGRLHLWECIFMVSYYIFYVVFVLVWHWYLAKRQSRRLKESLVRGHFAGPSEDLLLPPEQFTDDDRGLATPTASLADTSSADFSALEAASGHASDVDEDQDSDDDQARDHFLSQLSDNMHLTVPPSSHYGHNHSRKSSVAIAPIRPSLVGALEFQAVLNTLQKSRRTGPLILARCETVAPTLERAAGTDSHLQAAYAPTGRTAISRARAHSTNDALKTSHIASSSRLADIPPPALLDIVEEGLSPNHFTPLDHKRSVSADVSPVGRDPPSVVRASSPLHLTPRITFEQLSDDHSLPVFPMLPELATRLPVRSPSGRQSPLTVHSPLQSAISPLYLRDIDPFDETGSGEPPRWWPRILPSPQDFFDCLFPTLRRWSGKSWSSKIVSVVGVPSILLLTITLPVVYSDGQDDGGEDEVKRYESTPGDHTTALLSDNGTATGTNVKAGPDAIGGSSTSRAPPLSTPDSPRPETPRDRPEPARCWNRWLLVVQIFMAPLMLVFVIYTQYMSFEDRSFWRAMVKPILISLLSSLIILIPVLITSTPEHRPKAYQPILSLAGFIMSVAWISTVANQVVALLKTFALILHMSHAIMGLTFFAVGNSLSDLVADVTVARLGYPVMALSACFGGPMLNILLGIGLSGSWILIRGAERRHARHPDHEMDYRTYQIDVGRTLIVSGIMLLIGLVGLLVIVPLNKWMMDRKIAIALIALWALGTAINVALELSRGD